MAYVKGAPATPALKHAYTWDNMRRPSVREDYVGSTVIARRHSYAYNSRGELIGDTMNADGSFGYAYDNIGNRRTAAEQGISSSYQSNNLNQYTFVTRSGTPFTPEYDADGNQTGVNTSTGTWSVQYNADNRPVVFTQGSKRVECVYDYLGRRVEKVEYNGNTLTKRTRFAYMGYLMIASMDCTQNTTNPPLLGTWFWDPSEPVATRVLAMCTHNADKSVAETRYVAHDLLKSVSALYDASGIRQARFEYTPYGETLTEEGSWASSMPFRYSSEYRDDELGLIYYNYRHYNPQDGRWISRDLVGEEGGECLYGFVGNQVSLYFDALGLKASLQKCIFKVEAGHLGEINQRKNDFENNRLPSASTPCDKYYPISCGRTPNGGMLWGSEEAKKRRSVPTRDKDGYLKEMSKPGDSILSDEFKRKIPQAEKDAVKECENKKTCCSSIEIVVSCRPSRSMKGAKEKDKIVRLACSYRNTYTCKRSKKQPAKWKEKLFLERIQ